MVTMAEYIGREELISDIDAAMENAGLGYVVAQTLKRYVKRVPAADVAPVRHARWEVVVGSDGKEHMVCTGCRKQQDLTGVFSYCPNCGANMDGDTP